MPFYTTEDVSRIVKGYKTFECAEEALRKGNKGIAAYWKGVYERQFCDSVPVEVREETGYDYPKLKELEELAEQINTEPEGERK